MKLAIFGDLHYSERSPRAQHALDVLDAAIWDATEQGADAFYLLGDIFEGVPSPTEYRTILERLLELKMVGIVRGNHEHYHAYSFFELFSGERSLTVADTEFGITGTSEVRILMVPYPVRGRAPFADLDNETIMSSLRSAADRVGETVDRQAAIARESQRPLVVLGHFTIAGMTTRDTEFERHQANEVVVPPAVFDGAALTIVGHIHRAQEVTPNVIGAGDLYRTSFSEADDPKSYVLVTVDHGMVRWERRPTEARAMREVEVDLDDVTDEWVRDLARQTREMEVKVRIRMSEDQAPRYSAELFQPLEASAAYVVLERDVRPTQRVRAPAITVTMDTAAQVESWLAATGITVDEARRTRLRDKVTQIQ